MKLKLILNFSKKIELKLDNEITENNKAAALTQYDQLSNDWRYHASDIWKSLIAILAVHAGVYSLKLPLDGLFILIFLLGFTVTFLLAALKSDFYARKFADMRGKIAADPVIKMPFTKLELEGKSRKIFFKRSTLILFLIWVGILAALDIYIWLDP